LIARVEAWSASSSGALPITAFQSPQPAIAVPLVARTGAATSEPRAIARRPGLF
jgi:hypothetical protein